MKIKIVAVGKIKESFFREAIAEYSKRLSRFAAPSRKNSASATTSARKKI